VTAKLLTILALFASVAFGAGAGVFVFQVAAPETEQRDVKSITGVSSGVDGSKTKEEEEEGVDQVPLTPPPPPTTDPPPPEAATDPNTTQSQTVEIQGVDGTEGVDTEPTTTQSQTADTQGVDTEPNTAQSQTVDLKGVEGTEGVDTEPETLVEVITTTDGSVQSIRGIKGIDTVMLQNLEAVLRMQAPPPPPEEGGGGGRAAAALLTMESDEPPDPEIEVDQREELNQSEEEGS